MTGATVTVVVVHRDAPDELEGTLSCLARQGVDAEIVVVDNASSPGGVARARRVAEGAEFLTSGTNLGFGPAANVGLRRWLRRGNGPWVAVVPHDARPADGVLARLVDEASRRPRPGLVTADVGDQATPRLDRHFGAIWGPATVTDGWEDCDYPHGTLLVASRTCLETVGLFDERYFAYNDEADLGARARAAGFDVGLVRAAMVGNPSTSTPPWTVDYLCTRNSVLLVRTHGGRWPGVVRATLAVAQTAHQLVRPRRRTPWFVPAARLRAVLDAARGRWGPPPVRSTLR